MAAHRCQFAKPAGMRESDITRVKVRRVMLANEYGGSQNVRLRRNCGRIHLDAALVLIQGAVRCFKKGV